MSAKIIVLFVAVFSLGCNYRQNRRNISEEMRCDKIARDFSIELDKIPREGEGSLDLVNLDKINSIDIDGLNRVLVDSRSIRIVSSEVMAIDFDQSDFLYISIKTLDNKEVLWKIRPEVGPCR